MSVESGAELRPARKLFEHLAGTRPSPSTLHRWLHRGICGGVKLRAVRLGREWHCTREAADEFIAAQTSHAYAACSPDGDDGRAKRMDRDLAAAGLS